MEEGGDGAAPAPDTASLPLDEGSAETAELAAKIGIGICTVRSWRSLPTPPPGTASLLPASEADTARDDAGGATSGSVPVSDPGGLFRSDGGSAVAPGGQTYGGGVEVSEERVPAGGAGAGLSAAVPPKPKPRALPEVFPAPGPPGKRAGRPPPNTRRPPPVPRALPEVFPAPGPPARVDAAAGSPRPLPLPRPRPRISEGDASGSVEEHVPPPPTEGETGGHDPTVRPGAVAVPGRGPDVGLDAEFLDAAPNEGGGGGLDLNVPLPAWRDERRGRGRGRGRQRVPPQSNVSETVYDGRPIPEIQQHRGIWHFIKEHKRAVISTMAIVIILAIGVPAGAVFLWRKDDKGTIVPTIVLTSMPSPAPTSHRFFELKDALSLELGSLAQAFMDASSPQRRALLWLADDDTRRVPVDDVSGLRQRYALAVLFFATGGEDSWSEDISFLSGDHECYWHVEAPEYVMGYMGVLCPENSAMVRGVHLLENNLTGRLPEEICLLSSLWHLDLRKNSLTGPLPNSLGDLNEMLYLNINENNLMGRLPEEIGLLSSLITLNLRKNSLTGPLPNSLGNLNEMQHLMLNENALTGTVPSSLGNLAELEALGVWLNNLTGTIPPSLGKLSKIRVLLLTSNRLTGTIPLAITNASSLESLSLGMNELTGTLPFTTNSLSNLERLDLSENSLTGTIPEGIYSYSNLETLGLHMNALTGTLSPAVGTFSNLEWLSVAYNLLRGTIPTSISNLIRILYLGLNQFVGTVSLEFGRLQKLEELSLGGNQLTGTLPISMGNLTALQLLDLATNQFHGTVPHSLSNLKSLFYLGLANNSFTGDISFLCHNRSISIMLADCYGDDPEVDCGDCCTACCSDELGPEGPVNGCYP